MFRVWKSNLDDFLILLLNFEEIQLLDCKDFQINCKNKIEVLIYELYKAQREWDIKSQKNKAI